MRAVIMNRPHNICIGEWPAPTPGPDEVLISVRASGICAGDMYFYLGKNPYAVYPQICGHEIAGVVLEKGTRVTGLKPGTPVVVEPFLGCGRCYPCRIGKSNCCVNLQIIGVHLPGGYADRLVAPASHVHPIPPDLSPVIASFAEPVAIGVQACRRSAIQSGDLVLLLGCGPIGLAVIEVARAYGAQVIATDIVPERMAVAAKFGAQTLEIGDVQQQVLALTNGDGAPVVVEAAGSSAAMELAVDLVAAGGRVVILGLVKQGVNVCLPGLDLTRKEMTIVGSRASVRCFPEALKLLASGAITYPQVATEFSLWEAPAIFAGLADGSLAVHKTVLVNDDAD